MRIGAPSPMSGVTCHVSHFRCYTSGVMCQVPDVTYQVTQVECTMSGVTCQVSHVRCHMSGVTCHVTSVTFLLLFCFNKGVELVRRGSVINGAYPIQCHWRTILEYALWPEMSTTSGSGCFLLTRRGGEVNSNEFYYKNKWIVLDLVMTGLY